MFSLSDPYLLERINGFFNHSWSEITYSIVFFHMFVFSFSIKWFLYTDLVLFLFFLCFYVFVVDLLQYVLSPICCGVFCHRLMVGSFVLVLPMINFFVGFRIGNHPIKSCLTICYRSGILSILGIFGLSNV